MCLFPFLQGKKNAELPRGHYKYASIMTGRHFGSTGNNTSETLDKPQFQWYSCSDLDSFIEKSKNAILRLKAIKNRHFKANTEKMM
jgi:hypothetical protein